MVSFDDHIYRGFTLVDITRTVTAGLPATDWYMLCFKKSGTIFLASIDHQLRDTDQYQFTNFLD